MSESRKSGQFLTLISLFKMFQIIYNYCIHSTINNFKVKVKVKFEIYLEPLEPDDRV